MEENRKDEVMEQEITAQSDEGQSAKNKKPNKKSSKKAIIVIVLAAVIIVGCGIISAVKAMKQVEEAMGSVSNDDESLYTVDQQDVEQEITTSGTVVGISQNAYTSPVTAKVEDVCVEVGQTVKKGDVLLTYDASDLGDNLTKVKIQARSEKAAGDANYETADEAADKTSTAKKKVKKMEKEIAAMKKEAEAINDSITAYQDQMEDIES
ncbi:MAG: biotin/lipoyl-binding protein, partial [Lachnospiraceae bacterium]|nr:biotin/lipoyl-binding protein [Lachnospiraceae bacterium]